MQRYDWDGHGMDEVDIGGDYVRYEDAAALEAENAALREKLATAEVKPNLVGYDIEKDKEFKNGFNRLVESGIDKKTRRAIVKEVMEAIHAHAEASYQRGLAAAEARIELMEQEAIALGPEIVRQTLANVAAEARTVLTDQKIYEWAEGYQFSYKGNPHKMTFSRGRFIEAVRTILAASAAPAAQEDAKDAARYRWLCNNNFDKDVEQIHTWRHWLEPHSQTGKPTEWKQRVRGGALDATIDAAIAANTPGQGVKL